MRKPVVFAVAALLIGALTRANADLLVDEQEHDLDALPPVPPPFQIDFFVREPQISHPSALAFDARGRLFVGGGPQFRRPTPQTPPDSVLLVQGENGDGKADSVRTFATGFNSIQGLAWHGRDLYVANAPDLTLVRELDGDDVADEYITLGERFGAHLSRLLKHPQPGVREAALLALLERDQLKTPIMQRLAGSGDSAVAPRARL